MRSVVKEFKIISYSTFNFFFRNKINHLGAGIHYSTKPEWHPERIFLQLIFYFRKIKIEKRKLGKGGHLPALIAHYKYDIRDLAFPFCRQLKSIFIKIYGKTLKTPPVVS